MTKDENPFDLDIHQLPLQKAVALVYDGDHAPIVTAKGAGSEAQEIIDIAEAAGVPLCDNAALVSVLSELELGDEIPEALYLAVAHIIAFAYQLNFEAQSPKL